MVAAPPCERLGQPSGCCHLLWLLSFLAAAAFAAASDRGNLSWTHDLHVVNSSAGVAPAEALIDGSSSLCVELPVDETSPLSGAPRAWVVMDLGEEAVVNSVGLLPGSSLPSSGVAVTIQVFPSLDDLAADDSVTACGDDLVLQSGAWAQASCSVTGRYLLVGTVSATAVELCSIEAAHAGDAITSSSSSSGSSSEESSGLSGGAIAGIVVGAVAGAALLLCVGAALCKLRQRLQVQHAAAAKDKASFAKEDGKPSEEDSDGAMERGDGSPSAAYSSQRASEAPIQPTASLASAAASASRDGTLVGSGSPFAAFAGASSIGGRSEAGSGAAATDVSKLPRTFGTVSPSEVRLLDIIGEGSFASVYRAEWMGIIVAAKLFANHSDTSAAHTASRRQASMLRSLRAEASLLSALRHPNVCTFLGACEDPPYLLTEYCARKSVDGLLAAGLKHPKVAQRLSWARLLRMARDAAHGMAFLHARSVVHRDLKSANLLVDVHWTVKVCDFNLSRYLVEKEAQAQASTLLLQNPRWLSPEAMTTSGALTPAADVWSFGVVLYELATWRLPFHDLNAYQIIALVQAAVAADSQRSLLRAGCLAPPAADALPAGPLPCWGEYAALMAACLSPRPEDRPTFEAVVQRLGSMLEVVKGAGSAGVSASPTAVRTLRMPSRSAAYSASLSVMQQRQASMQRQSTASAASGSAGSAGSPRTGGGGGPQQAGGPPGAPPPLQAAIGGAAG